MSSLCLNYAINDGCPWNRFLLPARYCGPEFEARGHTISLDVSPSVIPDGHDWVGLHGILSSYAIEQVGRQKYKGTRFLWSLDDDMISCPDWNPAKPDEPSLGRWLICKELADLILVSTPALASTLSDVAHKVMIAPNLCEVSAFPPPPKQFVYEPPLRIVWAGGHTHKGDVGMIEELVERILSKHGKDKAWFVFFGMAPPGKVAQKYFHQGVIHQSGVPFPQYQKILNSLKPDIWLAPLADVPFNYSKSSLRIMDGWALVSAVVASPVGEYNLIRPGVDGRLADGIDAWESAVNRLITDHAHRCDLAEAGRVRVEKELNWNRPECRQDWVKVFERILR